MHFVVGLPTILLPLLFWFAIDVNIKDAKFFVLGLEILCVMIFILSFNRRLVGKMASNIQLVLCSVFFAILFMDICGRLFSDLLPYQIKIFLKDDNQSQRQAIIQYLDHSPWMKFKPNVLVQLPGFREPSDRFSYSWHTDDLGYKNDPRLLKMPIKAVALGDSFTEAMGCKIENTWETLLGAKGFSTYSMGVHGYAPSQMAATYEFYAQSFSPQYVFIGYTETIFQRESLFLKLTDHSKGMIQKQGLAALADQHLLLGRQEVRFVTRSPLLSVLMFIVSQNDPLFSKKITNTAFSSAELKNDVFLRYYDDLKYIDYNASAIKLIGNSPEWTKTMESFIKIKRMADTKNAKVVVIYFPSRYTVYYKRILGKSIPDDMDYGKIERKALEVFCLKNEIGFIDTSPYLESYVDSLPILISPSALPYFEFDMHMNPTGQKIVADVISTKLASSSMAH